MIDVEDYWETKVKVEDFFENSSDVCSAIYPVVYCNVIF
jgi:hypothetical protein